MTKKALRNRILAASVVLLLLIVILSNKNTIFFRPMNTDNVIRADITIACLYDAPVHALIENKNSIQSIVAVENLLTKNNWTNFLIKAKPWTVKIKYTLRNGKKIIRTYTGQTALTELQNEFSKIQEIHEKII